MAPPRTGEGIGTGEQTLGEQFHEKLSQVSLALVDVSQQSLYALTIPAQGIKELLFRPLHRDIQRLHVPGGKAFLFPLFGQFLFEATHHREVDLAVVLLVECGLLLEAHWVQQF